MEQVPVKVLENGIICKIKYSFFSQSEMEYLGLWATYKSLHPKDLTLEDIIHMAPPKLSW